MTPPPVEKAPYILGVAMRRVRPRRFETWTWSPRRNMTRHLSVAVYAVDGQLTARIWILGIAICVDEQPVASVAAGARWADRKLRGLLRALGVAEP